MGPTFSEYGHVAYQIKGNDACSNMVASLNMCFGCSKEPSHRDGSFEYPQHMFWLRNKKNNFQLGTLIWRPAITKILEKEKHNITILELKKIPTFQSFRLVCYANLYKYILSQ